MMFVVTNPNGALYLPVRASAAFNDPINLLISSLLERKTCSSTLKITLYSKLLVELYRKRRNGVCHIPNGAFGASGNNMTDEGVPVVQHGKHIVGL
jgi:hypothetical protein